MNLLNLSFHAKDQRSVALDFPKSNRKSDNFYQNVDFEGPFGTEM